MLVATLGVEVGGDVLGGAMELGVLVEDGVPAGAGLEPDVEDVHLLAEVVLCAAAGAGGAGGEQIGGGAGVPRVGALLGKQVRNRPVDGGLVERRVAALAEEDGDGDAPDALAGDAPVGAGADHVRDAVLAPGGVPVDGGDGVEGGLAEGDGCRRPAAEWASPWR